MPRYDVFLSHAGADKPAVERLALRLRDAGVAPFFDQWDLVPGERWIQELGEALAQSDTLAVFVGPKSGGGAWRTREVELALAREARGGAFRIIPVLLPGGDERAVEEISGFLGLLTWVDFRAGLDDEGAFRRLLAGIRGEAPGPGPGGGGARSYRCMAPAREPFVQRSEYAKVRDALLMDGTGDPGRAPTVGIATAIHGGGGFGKTSLAVEICHDEQVRQRYPDGILWVQMSDTLNDDGRLKEIRDVLRLWSGGEPPAFETVSKAGQHLIESLKGRRVLLVVDDVWRPEDVTPFQGLGPRAALLLTTRDSRTLPAGSASVHVDAMDVPEAVRLLGAGLPEGTSGDLRRLATRLGEWPLLLKIVNRQLRELIQDDGLSPEQSLREVNEALDVEGLTAFDREDLESRSEAVARTVGASLRRLSGEEVERFEQLAIFPEDKDIPLRVLEQLWHLGSVATKKFCGRLHDLSLLLRFDRTTGTIGLHDVIRAYLLKRGGSHLPKWHHCLLDAFRLANNRWSDLPREENYLWNHLFHHLIGAGESDLCGTLLLNLQYLQGKLQATDINALLSDYSPFVENDYELRLVRDALRLSAHVLEKSPLELPDQLWGRLLDRQEIRIQELLEQRVGGGVPWLRPRKASLIRPGEALIRSIEHPGLPTCLAVLSDCRVVSGSHDGKLRVWDVESGQILQTLIGHSGRIKAVAMLDGWRVVSGGADGTVRVWDTTSGQALRVLEGHSNYVSAVVVMKDGRVVSGSSDQTLRLWDVESGQHLRTFKGLPRGSNTLAVLNSCWVVSGAADGRLLVWNVDSGQALPALGWHSKRINTVAVLDGQSGREVVSGSDDRTLQVWDAASGQALQTLAGHTSRINAVAVLDGYRVVTGSDDRTLRIWDVKSGQALQTLHGHSSKVNAVAVLDQRRVVSCSSDQTLRVWNVESGQSLPPLERRSSWVSGLAVLNNSQVASASFDEQLRVWDVESGQNLQALEGDSFGGSFLAVLDTHQVVSGSTDGMLRVWDIRSGQAIQTLEGHSDWISAVVVLRSHWVLFGSDNTLRLWDLQSGEILQTLKGHSDWVGAVAVLDSRKVVSGSEDLTLRIWDVETGQTLQILNGHFGPVGAVALLDSRRVVSGSADRTLRVWDVKSGQTLQILEGHSSGVSAVAVLDGCRVVSGSSDRTLRVWDVNSGEIECRFTLDAWVTSVAVIPDRRIVVAGDGLGRVHFFDFVEL